MVSNLVSNARYPHTCATPPPGDTVYEPDLGLGVAYRQANAIDAS